VLDGAKLTADGFADEIDHVLGDEKEQDRLSVAIRTFGRPHAAEELASLVLKIGKAPIAIKNRTRRRKRERTAREIGWATGVWPGTAAE